MPKYIGKGVNFYLVVCELMPLPNVSKNDKIAFHETVCGSCGFYKDTKERAERARKVGKGFRRLICVRPENKAIIDKWKQHITVWAT